MSSDTTSLMVALLPLVLVIVGLSQYLLKIMRGSGDQRETLLDMIQKLKIEVADVQAQLARVTDDNAELKRENDELRLTNTQWRKAARRWYLIAVSVNKEFRSQAEEGLEEPTDF